MQIPEYEIKSLARFFAPQISEFFASKEGQKEYEEGIVEILPKIIDGIVKIIPAKSKKSRDGCRVLQNENDTPQNENSTP